MSFQVQAHFARWYQRVGHSFPHLPNQFVHIFSLAFNPGRISSNVMFSPLILHSSFNYSKKTALYGFFECELFKPATTYGKLFPAAR